MTFFDKIPNYRKAELFEESYSNWKKQSLENSGYFPVFSAFKEDFYLKELSGNAIKLYLYLGLHSNNNTGVTWVSIDNIASYFEKSPRAISNWIDELKKVKLIERMQFEKNGVSYTFLRPYGKR